jgi:hypothetical protein
VTLHPNGTVTCDRCGGDCGNGGITECVPFPFLTPGGDVEHGHWCLRDDDAHDRCAAVAINADTMAASHPGGVALYLPPEG